GVGRQRFHARAGCQLPITPGIWCRFAAVRDPTPAFGGIWRRIAPGAEAEIRTRMPLRAAVFKTAASAVPPPRQPTQGYSRLGQGRWLGLGCGGDERIRTAE